MKRLVVFDLDGTLAESKSALDAETDRLLNELLKVTKVSVISGGAWTQFEKQLLSNLTHGDALKNLFLLPTCGTKFYRYEAGWKLLYSEDFSSSQREKILSSLQQSIHEADFKIAQTWGDQVEDRGSQITFSALGQKAPLDEKKKWDPDLSKRKRMKELLDKLIPEFSVNIGGSTSIDITEHGIDKAYGIRKLRDVLKIPVDEMIYLGDAVFPGGNDYPAVEAGVSTILVKDPQETKAFIQGFLCYFDHLPKT